MRAGDCQLAKTKNNYYNKLLYKIHLIELKSKFLATKIAYIYTMKNLNFKKTQKKTDKKKNKSELNKFLFYTFVIIIIWTISFLALNITYSSLDDKTRFGDIFGAINTLFSGLAFAGIIFTIQLQRKDLKLQREDLKMTRMELQRSASAQEKSENALKEQSKSLEATAKISALNTLVQAYNAKIIGSANSGKSNNFDKKRDICIKHIEKFLELKAEENRIS